MIFAFEFILRLKTFYDGGPRTLSFIFLRLQQQQGHGGFYPSNPYNNHVHQHQHQQQQIQQQQQQHQQQLAELSQISIPNSSVGAIIGAGGSNIKQIIRDSNAYVTVSSAIWRHCTVSCGCLIVRQWFCFVK